MYSIDVTKRDGYIISLALALASEWLATLADRDDEPDIKHDMDAILEMTNNRASVVSYRQQARSKLATGSYDGAYFTTAFGEPASITDLTLGTIPFEEIEHQLEVASDNIDVDELKRLWVGFIVAYQRRTHGPAHSAWEHAIEEIADAFATHIERLRKQSVTKAL
jgi:hypothetical protein